MTTAAKASKAVKTAPKLQVSKLSQVASMATKKAPDTAIALAQIDTAPQVRTTFVNLDELAASIKELGILEPLIVLAKEDNRYLLVAGERRFRAAGMAGLEQVPVIIKRDLDEKQIRHIQVTENNERDNLTPAEEAAGVIEDVEKFGTQEAMRLWNRGEAWISKRVSVKKYRPVTRSMLESSLCGDFEILHCMNQIEGIDADEAARLKGEMEKGNLISREEARLRVTRLKDAASNKGKEQAGQESGAVSPAIQAQPEAPAGLPVERPAANEQPVAYTSIKEVLTKVQPDALSMDELMQATQGQWKQSELLIAMNFGVQSGELFRDATTYPARYKIHQATAATEQVAAVDESPATIQQPTPVSQPADVGEETLASEEVKPTGEALGWARENIHDSGLAIGQDIKTIINDCEAMGMSQDATDWPLWIAFQDTMLPLFAQLGEVRAKLFMKRLQNELKGTDPMALWEKIHPLTGKRNERDAAPEMPEGWKL